MNNFTTPLDLFQFDDDKQEDNIVPAISDSSTSKPRVGTVKMTLQQIITWKRREIIEENIKRQKLSNSPIKSRSFNRKPKQLLTSATKKPIFKTEPSCTPDVQQFINSNSNQPFPVSSSISKRLFTTEISDNASLQQPVQFKLPRIVIQKDKTISSKTLYQHSSCQKRVPQSTSTSTGNTSLHELIEEQNTPMQMTEHQDWNISQFETEQKPEPEKSDDSEFTSQNWTVVKGRPRRRHRLGQQMKNIMSIYQSSVLRFSHDVTRGKFEDVEAKILIVRAVAGRENRFIWTICHDVQSQSSQIVLFRPRRYNDIVPLNILKLYRPWQEVHVSGITNAVITCTDFYKHVDGSSISMSPVLKEILRHNPVIGLDNCFDFKIYNSDRIQRTFLDLVPYYVTNEYTIRKQTSKFKPYINLDIIVHHIWNINNHLVLLIRDSDNVFALLKIKPPYPDFAAKVSIHNRINFRRIGISSKITANRNETLFSVLRFYGSYQLTYYILTVRPDTQYSIKSNEDKAKNNPYPEFKNAVYCYDERITVRCKVQRRHHSDIDVIDDGGNDLNIVLLCRFGLSYRMFKYLFPGNQVRLTLLRSLHRQLIFDEYSCAATEEP